MFVRRSLALLTMLVFVGMVTLLVWRIWEHHEDNERDDAGTSAAMAFPSA